MTPGIWTGIYAEAPLHGAFRALYDCGWRAFEVSTEHLVAIETHVDSETQIEEALRCARKLGVAVRQAHGLLEADVAAPSETEREKDIGHLLTHIKIAARLGVRVVVIHPGGKTAFTTRTQQRRIRECNIEAFRRLGNFAAECGLRIGIENMMRHGAATPADILDLLEEIDHPTVGITLDTSHAHVAGLNISDVVHELGPHLVATHISDNDGSSDQHRTPSGGTIDWTAVMAALREIKYDGLFNLEIPGEHHPDPTLQQIKMRYALEVSRWLVSLADAGQNTTAP